MILKGFMILMLTSQIVLAQSSLLGKNESGFQADVGLLKPREAFGFLTSGGYSYKGVLDFGLSIGRISGDYSTFTFDNFERIDTKFDYNQISIGSSISYHFIKSYESKKISASTFLGYSRDFLSGELYDLVDGSTTQNNFSVGLNLYTRESLSKNFNLIIQATGAFIRSDNEISSYSYHDENDDIIFDSNDDEDILLGVSFSFVRRTLDSTRFIFTPSFYQNDGNFGFALSVGFLFGTN